ncbi:HD domain-containing protein [Campylobacter sp. RM9334]|uniref:HD domain-containing phosphohydrolase n=1 Tax=Campylobacter sp. RM9334 TaxID=2735732 RepID=UPI001D769DB3|nr:HD domain-containing protein [Campylobacter sp. RM9334]
MNIFNTHRIVFEGSSVSKYLSDNLTCIQFSLNGVIDAGFLPKPTDDNFIKHVFISHTHLDHICAIALYVDNYFLKLQDSICIYASKESINNLKEHFFNNKIWPDFAKIKLPNGSPAIVYKEINVGDKLLIDDITIEPVKSYHTEGSFGFILSYDKDSIYFTSDTYYHDDIVELINKRTDIRQVIADVSFDSSMDKLAKASKHLTPKLLKKIQEQVRDDVIFHVYHIKYCFKDKIEEELREFNILKDYGMIIKNGSFMQFNTNYQSDMINVLKRHNLDQEQKLETILECFSQISKNSDSKANLNTLGEMVKQNIQADRCSVWFIDNERKEYYTLHADGVGEIRVPFGKGIVGRAIETKEAILENNPKSNPYFDSSNDERTKYSTKSILAMPILNSEHEVIGVFQALNKLTDINNNFDKDDLDYLRIAADYSGKIYEGMKFQEDILNAQKDLIYSIAEMVESKSEETGNHVKRVGKISEAIARQMGLSEEEVTLISYGAPTHDIGKIGIPDAILNKPGRLDEKEFKTMQKHAQIGYEMLHRFKGKIMEAAAIIAHEHHEKYAGGGYPMGKKGDDIHIYARIVSLADVFDALASDRCYKKAWPLDEVCKYISDNSGFQFDPKVVEAFFACKEEIFAIKEKYVDKYIDDNLM